MADSRFDLFHVVAYERQPPIDPRVLDLLESYQAEVGSGWKQALPLAYPSGRAILEGEVRLRIEALLTILSLNAYPRPAALQAARLSDDVLRPLLLRLCRARLSYTPDDVERIARVLASRGMHWNWWIPIVSLINSVEVRVAEVGLTDGARASLHEVHEAGFDGGGDADGRKALAKIESMLGIEEFTPLIDDRDDWGAAANLALRTMDSTERVTWTALLSHAAMLTGTRPSRRWLAMVSGCADAVGREDARELLIAWLGLLDTAALNETYHPRSGDPMAGLLSEVPTTMVTAANASVLTGLVWTCSIFDDAALAALVAQAAATCLAKVPRIGPRSIRVANACLNVLGEMPPNAAIVPLLRLRQRFTAPSAQRAIVTVLNRVASVANLPLDDLEELSIPTLGLEDGRIRREFGEYCVEIVAEGAQSVRAVWTTNRGRPLKNEPSALKRTASEDLRQVKELAWDVRSTLATACTRLDGLMIRHRTWSLADWRERYLDHPLVGVLARRLIWDFEPAGSGAWLDGQIVDAADRPVSVAGDTRVRLWHPMAEPPGVVADWRQWVERHGIVQPFKQAHREVYLLTEAERQTATHSNRFANHVLRHQQFMALTMNSHWRYQPRARDDAKRIPNRVLDEVGLRAELWVEAAESDNPDEPFAGDTPYVVTDRVHFRSLRSGELAPLVDVPPRVFSEVMRDVDVFVNVCSIGNDPFGGNRGPTERRAYWQHYAFGELAESARTRQEVLQRLLPRLPKLDGRWSIADRFVIVRGDVRTYKIHMGSGNVLMEPNNQYLCIVRDPTVEDGARISDLFLPFEGDLTLATIVSKALLLVDDRTITDPTITRQIGTVAS
jgi:hypothetical protein